MIFLRRHWHSRLKATQFYHRVGAGRSPVLAFFLTFILISWIYRLWFYHDLHHVMGISLASAKIYFCYGTLNDFKVATVFSAIIIIINFIFNSFKIFPRLLATIGLCSLYLLLFLTALLFAVQQSVFIALFSNISVSMIEQALEGFGFTNFIANISLAQWIFLLLPLLLFSFFLWLKATHLILYKIIIIIPVVLLSTGYAYLNLKYHTYNSMYAVTFQANPYVILLHDYCYTLRKNKYSQRTDLPSVEQLSSVQLIDPRFINPRIENPVIALTRDDAVQNIILIILESVGSAYIFDTTLANTVPMTFIHRLSQAGVQLTQHYAGSNSSPPGLFTLFAGIYPNPSSRRFEMQPNNRLPSIATFLPSTYHKFIVTPGAVDYYMPVNYLKNSGFTLYGQRDIPSKRRDHRLPNYLNEMDAMDFFLAKLGDTPSPFLAVYYSGVPHTPYVDYGVQWRIISDVSIDKNRYYNGLFMLDSQLSRIWSVLADKKLLDKTLWVIVADHGEGFGQHALAWRHGATIFAEETHIPAIFYQPLLFKPQIITHTTSNIDILPTLLDSLNIAYPLSQVQGQSLVAAHPQRRYLFLYGVRHDLTGSIDANQFKMEVDFFSGACRVYDLNQDSQEQYPEDCDHYPEQLSDLIAYKNYQSALLLASPPQVS